VKTAISFPHDLFKQADLVAARLGKSRSQFIADALRQHIRDLGESTVTSRLDAVYGDEYVADEDRRVLDAMAAAVRENHTRCLRLLLAL